MSQASFTKKEDAIALAKVYADAYFKVGDTYANKMTRKFIDQHKDSIYKKEV